MTAEQPGLFSGHLFCVCQCLCKEEIHSLLPICLEKYLQLRQLFSVYLETLMCPQRQTSFAIVVTSSERPVDRDEAAGDNRHSLLVFF